jgi:hypothetical protein
LPNPTVSHDAALVFFWSSILRQESRLVRGSTCRIGQPATALAAFDQFAGARLLTRVVVVARIATALMLSLRSRRNTAPAAAPEQVGLGRKLRQRPYRECYLVIIVRQPSNHKSQAVWQDKASVHHETAAMTRQPNSSESWRPYFRRRRC